MNSSRTVETQAIPPMPNGAADFHGMIGTSPAMQRVYERIERFARLPVPLLILGETGTGKDMAARAIQRIAFSERPLVAVNCAAIPKTLIESELFGHEQGAFTGATRRRVGILAQADGGILFLDEVAEIPLSTQAKLLRAIETGEFRLVGGEKVQRSRFRLITATNRDLNDLVARKRFRLDLLHRLGAARIVIPPLRDRLEDITPLTEEFLRRFRAASDSVGPARLSACALGLCYASGWPGNVRELKNVVEAAASMASGATVEAEHLREFVSQAECTLRSVPEEPVPTLAEAIRRAEQDTIREAMRRAGGDRERAAAMLGISVTTLYRRLLERPGAPLT